MEPAPPTPATGFFVGRLARLAPWARVFRPAGEDGGSGGRLPLFFPAFLVLFLVGMGLISLVGDQGLISYFRLQEEAGRLRAQVTALKIRRTHLVREITALREDSSYVEFLARKKLGLVRPGDIVIQLPTGQGPP